MGAFRLKPALGGMLPLLLVFLLMCPSFLQTLTPTVEASESGLVVDMGRTDVDVSNRDAVSYSFSLVSSEEAGRFNQWIMIGLGLFVFAVLFMGQGDEIVKILVGR